MFSATASILWLLLPPIAWVFRKRLPFVHNRLLLLFTATVIAGSLLYIGAVWLANAEIEHALYKFDLDGDREFSEMEYTADAQKAMKRYANDTGRSFVPLVAAPATLVSTSVWFAILEAGSWLSKKMRHNDRKSA